MGYAIRRDVIVVTLLLLTLFVRPSLAADQEKIDPKAGVIEVLVPPSIEQVPQAVALLDRIIHKHALLLRSPALMTNVVKADEINRLPWVRSAPETAVDRLTNALHLRVIPDTNLIEINIDSGLAGDDGPRVIEEVVDQYLEKLKTAVQNAMLEQSVMLNNLKNRYQFRKDDLNRDLREKTVALSIDGMGQSQRLIAQEAEVQNLLQQRADWQRKMNDAATDEAKKTIQAQQETLDKKIDVAKADMGALSNALNNYRTNSEDMATNRAQLKEVNEELEKIQQSANTISSGINWVYHPSR